MALKAYVFIDTSSGQVKKVLDALKNIREVTSAEACWGKPDIVAQVEATDNKALTTLVLSKIHTVPGMVGTETHILCEF